MFGFMLLFCVSPPHKLHLLTSPPLSFLSLSPQGTALAEKYSCRYIETSAKENQNVEAVFLEIVNKVIFDFFLFVCLF